MIHDHKEAMQADQSGKPVFWRSRYGLGLLVFGIATTYFLVTEHRAHFFGALPFLILLACPLMHVFAAVRLAQLQQKLLQPPVRNHEK